MQDVDPKTTTARSKTAKILLKKSFLFMVTIFIIREQSYNYFAFNNIQTKKNVPIFYENLFNYKINSNLRPQCRIDMPDLQQVIKQ